MTQKLKAQPFLFWLSAISVALAAVSSGSAQQPTLRHTLEGHPGIVMSVGFSPDGMVLASTGSHGTLRARDYSVRLWDPITGKNLALLDAHESGVHCSAFSPDGKTLASASARSIRLWDATTGKSMAVFADENNAICTIAFSPDGKTLISGGANKLIVLWEAASGKKKAVLNMLPDGRLPLGAVVSLSFSPAGKTFASASGDSVIRIWDAAKGTMISAFEVNQTYGVNNIAYSPDARILAATGGMNRRVGVKPGVGKPFVPGPELADCDVHLVEAATGKRRADLKGHNGIICSIAFSPDGKTLASASYDSTVRLWDIGTGKCIATLKGHTEFVRSVAFSPDGRTLASGGDDGTIRLWDLQPAK